MSVFLANLPHSFRLDALKADFKRLGSCKFNYFVRSTQGGFAFVEYDDIHAAELAVEHFDRCIVEGNELRVELTSKYSQPSKAIYKPAEPCRSRSRSPQCSLYQAPNYAEPLDHETGAEIEEICFEQSTEIHKTLSRATVSRVSQASCESKETDVRVEEIVIESDTTSSDSEEADFVPLMTPTHRRRSCIRLLGSSRRKLRRRQRSPELLEESGGTKERDQIMSADGTVFEVVEELDDGLKVVCYLCETELKATSISSHLETEGHKAIRARSYG
jgi:hypothetical protein